MKNITIQGTYRDVYEIVGPLMQQGWGINRFNHTSGKLVEVGMYRTEAIDDLIEYADDAAVLGDPIIE